MLSSGDTSSRPALDSSGPGEGRQGACEEGSPGLLPQGAEAEGHPTPVLRHGKAFWRAAEQEEGSLLCKVGASLQWAGQGWGEERVSQ